MVKNGFLERLFFEMGGDGGMGIARMDAPFDTYMPSGIQSAFRIHYSAIDDG